MPNIESMVYTLFNVVPDVSFDKYSNSIANLSKLAF